MSATDELRRILDERGVEWETNETLTDCWTRWNVGNLRCTATEINGIFAFTIGNCTPEKAIAATLGSGTLTAEQVREAIKANAYPETSTTFEFGSSSWQEIADELNSRAERTCECVADYAESPFDGKTIVLHRCSACHELMRPHMRYCPNCGRKVKR